MMMINILLLIVVVVQNNTSTVAKTAVKIKYFRFIAWHQSSRKSQKLLQKCRNGLTGPSLDKGEKYFV